MSHLGERLSALIDGELSCQQRERVLAHLARCEPCRQEAAALRLLKQRMRGLGDTSADDTLTERLIGLAGLAAPSPGAAARRPRDRNGVRAPGWYGPPRRPRRRPVRSAVMTAVAALAFGLPVAAFVAGGGQSAPGPKVTPAVDVFMVQHAITNGELPARQAPSLSPGGSPLPAPSPARHPSPGASSPAGHGR